MSDGDRIQAKAESVESRSDAIVVSFGADWYAAIRRSSFRLILRKRVPVRMAPRSMYFHVNAPKSAICGSAEILSIDSISLPRALELAGEIGLSASEIREYFENRMSMGCYRVGKIRRPQREVSTSEIAAHIVYHPPQSFFALSKEGKGLLDEICGFVPRTSTLRAHRT